MSKQKQGAVRDAIIETLSFRAEGASVAEIVDEVTQRLGPTPTSSIRSYLRLNTPNIFTRRRRGHYRVREDAQTTLPFPGQRTEGTCHAPPETTGKIFSFGNSMLLHQDCFAWLETAAPNSVQAVVTDPPYGLVEYSEEEQAKLRSGRGGVWRVPPSFDGNLRAPLPRFTVLSPADLAKLERFFFIWARLLHPVLVPGANVIVASNPLLSFLVASAITRAGFERRGEIIRLTMTMRGGDRPKAAHEEFPERQCHAALDVGAMAHLPQTARGPGAG